MDQSAVCCMAPVVECDLPSSSNATFKLSVEMCQNLVSVGTWEGEKITFLSLMFFHSQNKFDKYLNHLEMKPRQVPVESNGTFAMSYVRIQSGGKRPFVVTFNK